MGVRPIVRLWRGLPRGPFVLHRGPSRPASNFMRCARVFNPAKTAFVVPRELEFHGQVKTLDAELESRFSAICR